MEELMQHVWRFRLWPPGKMATVDGESVEVIDPGLLNRDAGPDFFNAKVVIGGQLWIGNVELHLRASDWRRHGHDRDAAYHSVVLHVVESSDERVSRPDGTLIPQMVLSGTRDFAARYRGLLSDPEVELPCAGMLSGISALHRADWLTALGHERLQAKADRVLAAMEQGDGWHQAMYVTLARAMGFGTNADPFELLARCTPLKALLRHIDQPNAVEAMMLGQAGLLPRPGECAGEPEAEAYAEQLRADYAFYGAKYGLRPAQGIAWKMSRMRPQNFPHRRIAALAAMIRRGSGLWGALPSVGSIEEAERLLSVRLEGFWASHYTFGPSASTAGSGALSRASMGGLVINAVAPIMYAMGEYVGDDNMQHRAKELLHELPAESNSVVGVFARAGIRAGSAFDTQALLQLRRAYCEPRKCLYCRFGHRLLSQPVGQLHV